MKLFAVLSLFSLVFLTNACSTNRGGTAENYDTLTGSSGNPVPVASPTERPGMTPEDLRDPQHLTRPEPLEFKSGQEP